MAKFEFKFIDLFAGIGGFHQAMTLFGGKCVFASEIDEECKKQYEKQFRMKVHGDINNCMKDIPSFDVLCGGFPCQTFSKAGNQEGFEDEVKGKLFYRIVDILKAHPECKFLILENVRNLADQKAFWDVIQKELRELDFFITQDPIIESPSSFGIPQNRERVYILGIKKTLRNTSKLTNGWIHTDDLHLDSFRKPCADGVALSPEFIEYGSEKGKTKAIDAKEMAVISAWEYFKKNILPNKQIGSPIWLDFFGIGYGKDQTEAFYQKCGYYKQLVKAKKKDYEDEKKETLINKKGYIWELTPDWKKHFIERNRAMYLEHQSSIDDWYAENEKNLTQKVYRKFEWNCGPNYRDFKECIIQFRQSGLRIKRPDTFPSLVAIVNTPIIWDKELKLFRRITLREAANLQSFRKNYDFVCDERTSYKQLGNSVNVKVIKIIAKQLFDLGIDGWDQLQEDSK